MSRPTAQRATYRTSVTASVGATSAGCTSISRRPGAATGVMGATYAPSGGGFVLASPVASQAPAWPCEGREEMVSDTWSGFLSSQFAARVEKGSRAPGPNPQRAPQLQQQQRASVPAGTAYMTRTNMLTTLTACIGKHNETWERVRIDTVTERCAENARHAQQLAATTVGSTEVGAATAPAAAAAPVQGVENKLVATVLQRMLASSQERWQTLLTTRIDAAVTHEAELKARAEREREQNRRNSVKAAGSASPRTTADANPVGEPPLSESPPPPPPALPSAEELYTVLVEGLNDPVTSDYVTDELGVSMDAGGISPVGLITPFEAHVQALLYWFPTIVPSRKALRRAFADLDPRRLSCASNPVSALDTALASAEEQLDLLLRHGDRHDALRAILLSALHPAIRRLIYPRAFGLPLRVTDGKPPFPAEGDATVNSADRLVIPTFLTCASRYGRDKLRRRYQHTFSTPLQSDRCRALQGMAERDVRVYVGDSDRYFIYQDETALVATAMVADRGVPVNGMRAALEQLGRTDDALDAYVVYLRSEENGMIQQRAPPCGFFPIAGTSSLIAPLGNVTGDTVEQYELAAAMFGQLWGRLQGPTPELLQCCLIFEQLVTEMALPATLHATRVLQTPPLRLALQWMLTGFADVLEPLELLILWDWLAAYHVEEMHARSALSRPVGLASTTTLCTDEDCTAIERVDRDTTAQAAAPPCALWLLPVMAASLFAYRAPLVLKCRSRLDMEALFVSNHHVTCRPLLQAFLFTDALK